LPLNPARGWNARSSIEAAVFHDFYHLDRPDELNRETKCMRGMVNLYKNLTAGNRLLTAGNRPARKLLRTTIFDGENSRFLF
jgi:hypothetical protein